MTDSILAAKSIDGFKNESPIRAFTDFQTSGTYAIGKGFRPSLTHLATYLDAMEAKEGWALVQVILPQDDASDPTILFSKVLPPMLVLNAPTAQDVVPPAKAPTRAPKIPKTVDERTFNRIAKLMDIHGEARRNSWVAYGTYFPAGSDMQNESLFAKLSFLWPAAAHQRINEAIHNAVTTVDDEEPEAVRTADDQYHEAIYPAHYGGNACMEIIEYMPTNIGIAAKYVWRLGAKDPVAQEIGKAVRYLDREIALQGQTVAPKPVFGLPTCSPVPGIPHGSNAAWYEDMARERIKERAMPAWRAAIMRALVKYTVTGNLVYIKEAIHHFTIYLEHGEETTTGAAV